MPERLGYMVILNPPRYFSALYAVLSLVANARQMAKVRILHCDASTAIDVLSPLGMTAETGLPQWIGRTLSLAPEPGNVAPLDGLDLAVLSHLAVPGTTHGLAIPAPNAQ